MSTSRFPVLLVLIGIASVQFGAGLAKSLFDEVSPTTIVWLRLFASAVVLVAWARPSLRGRSRTDWAVVVAFGVALGTMNWAIYQSFSRIPLGIAVTIEFTGPLVLAVAGSRRARDLVWIGLAALGVLLLGFERGDLTVAGVAFALLAAVAWAAYILLSARTGQRWAGLDGLAVASVVGLALVSPLALGGHAGDLGSARIWLIGAAVGVLSSVIPYSCELVALRSLAPSVFGVLMSLEPAAAALAGWAVVGEMLTAVQWVALLCVVVASIGMTRTERPKVPVVD
ncbi:EamA family transporter [Nocardioides sp. CER19]|uniref:EamA family transporter n=1 Tax=Nocardioides sp. CER19 TaxID=3038538 RepID=UPI00244D40C4|nr:EamA family transporter [Nocardioides sp. CER19]MDH2414106.1 EamA family transporter [Nocardioides sp. CER19]